MFKEILWLVPRLSQGDLNKMERQLSTRFGTIAGKFGKGIVSTITTFAKAGLTALVAALGITVIDKLIHPLKETQDLIDKILGKGDDAVTNAKEFGTTAGKLIRLQQLATANGLDESTLNTMLIKFQSALAEAGADPTKDTSVRAFVGQKDIAEAFFQFITNLKKLKPAQQTLVQNEIFGEKQRGKASQFFQADLAKQLTQIGGPGAKQLTDVAESLDRLNGRRKIRAAGNEGRDFVNQGGSITEKNVSLSDALARQQVRADTIALQGFDAKAELALKSGAVAESLQTVAEKSTGMLNKLIDILGEVRQITKSRGVKGAGGNSFSEK